MCGIVGYVGEHQSKAFLLEGLRQLEYRGYDSMGLACLRQDTEDILWAKVIGGIDALQNATDAWLDTGFCGISHSRWATHGEVSQENAHPHFDCERTVAVVHNGIIENYIDLKHELSGHVFRSTTDTEVVAHYFEHLLEQKMSLHEAIVTLTRKLQGAFALVIMLKEYPHTLIAIRKKSPLCIGYAQNSFFVASDPQAFIEYTTHVSFLEDETFACISAKKGVSVFTFNGEPCEVAVESIDKDRYAASKQHFSHYMAKEIYEQKRVIYDTVAAVRSLSDEALRQTLSCSLEYLRTVNEIELIGCGTSTHAAAVAQHFLTDILNVPVFIYTASEYRFKRFFANPWRLSIFLSQSGETADTLEALREAKKEGCMTIALTNVPTSTITREAHGVLLMHAQREISVASTKCFIAQIALLYAWAARVAQMRGGGLGAEQAYANLIATADALEDALHHYRPVIEEKAALYAEQQNFIFLGRQSSYAFACEAALKLKEIAYKFVDCYPAGELKHGHIALIEPGFPVFIFSLLDEKIYTKLLSNAQEVKARKGHLTVFAFEDQYELLQLADHAFVFKKVDMQLSQLVMTGVMQYFMFEIARILGHSIDKPRNLAKSVTVE